MTSSSAILGINARSRLFLPFNNKEGRRIADSKLLTKKRLKKHDLPVPSILAVFKTPQEVKDFPWETLPDNFVLKPSKGFGGQGVVIIKRRAKWAGEWRLMNDSLITSQDLKFHTLEILSGRFSLHNVPDIAFIEERIKIQKIFSKYVYHGAPDIRLLVFNKIPVAAMLRLPTKESQGHSNIHQGAIGVGIDLATGITTHGILAGNFIKYIPGTKRKINGLRIPEWNKILTLGVKAQELVPSLGFLGIDIILDKERGPMILELNARPGLEIQNANLAPLKKRLERIEGLEVKSAEQGVKIAKALFMERFADRVIGHEEVQILNALEKVKIKDAQKKKTWVKAKIDTGAWRTAIDKELAEKLGLLGEDNILGETFCYSALGGEKRPLIKLRIFINGAKIDSLASVTDRGSVRYPLVIGRRDLRGFLVRPRKF